MEDASEAVVLLDYMYPVWSHVPIMRTCQIEQNMASI